MQTKDFSIAKYNDPVNWINRQIEHNIDWSEMLITKLIANTVFKLNCTHN